MFIADAHCDTLYMQAVAHQKAEDCSVTYERLKRGGVGIQTFALFSGSKEAAKYPLENGVKMLKKALEMPMPIYAGRLPQEPPVYPSGVLSIEGGEMLKGSLENLDYFYNLAGIRMIALTWNYENEIGYPMMSGEKLGLKPFGRQLVREMDRRGIYSDVSHLNERGFWELIDCAQLPPIASHSNLRSLCDQPRNLNEAQVRAIIERGGYIGINFYSHFLAQGRPATTQDVVEHIDAIAQMGGIGVLGFGSDFDGIDESPEGLSNPEHFPILVEALKKRGYTQEDVAAICGENLWRLLKKAEAIRYPEPEQA